MSLIKCQECKKDVSEKATACPHCGNPMNNKTVEVELTNKGWKLVKLFGWITFLLGIFIFLSYIQQRGIYDAITGFGLTAIFIGFIMILIGKIGAWWGNR